MDHHLLYGIIGISIALGVVVGVQAEIFYHRLRRQRRLRDGKKYWEARIAQEKAAGAKVITPNGLPIRCIRDGALLEDEHGDHPDYKFPVDVDYLYAPGKITKAAETHALIYTDGHIAVSIYECCYAMWSLRDGSVISGDLWKDGNFKLSQISLDKIRKLKFPQ